MVQLTELNGIAIAQICFFVPSLAVAIFLASRHGFGRSAGWLYLILFSTVRILGAALELATINDPTSIGLAVGAFTLQSIGLAPLILVMLASVGRVLEGIRFTHPTPLTPQHLRFVQIIVILAMVLGAVGGSFLSGAITDFYEHPSSSGTYAIPVESQVGAALMIVGFAVVILIAGSTLPHLSYVPAGEKRLLLAIGLAAPFVLVRLIFSAMASLSSNVSFRAYGGGQTYVTLFLAMSVIMEIIAVIIFESIGLTLQRQARQATGTRTNPDRSKRGRFESVPLTESRNSAGQV